MDLWHLLCNILGAYEDKLSHNLPQMDLLLLFYFFSAYPYLHPMPQPDAE